MPIDTKFILKLTYRGQYVKEGNGDAPAIMQSAPLACLSAGWELGAHEIVPISFRETPAPSAGRGAANGRSVRRGRLGIVQQAPDLIDQFRLLGGAVQHR